MSNHRHKAQVKRQKVKVQSVKRVSFFLLPFVFLLFTGCRMDMQDQPRLEAYEKGAIRQPVAGTVPRGFLRADKQLYTGKKDQAGAAQKLLPNQTAGQGTGNANMAASALYPDVVDTFPFPVTEEIIKRGEERYNIFCAMCHGPTGYGDGMIVRRGYSRPPSYHTDQLRQAPVGHYFDVMTNGWGAMPSYAAQIPVADRWAIVAYIRALQLSQNPQGTSSSNNAAANAPQTQPPAPGQTPAARPTPRAETGGRR